MGTRAEAVAGQLKMCHLSLNRLCSKFYIEAGKESSKSTACLPACLPRLTLVSIVPFDRVPLFFFVPHRNSTAWKSVGELANTQSSSFRKIE